MSITPQGEPEKGKLFEIQTALAGEALKLYGALKRCNAPRALLVKAAFRYHRRKCAALAVEIQTEDEDDHHECAQCDGTGECYCNGAGRCYSCRGTLVCSWCDGTGWWDGGARWESAP